VTVPEPSTQEEARDVLTSYLMHAARLHKGSAVRPSDPLLMKLGRLALPVSLRTSIRLILTDLLRWRERKRSAGLSSPLRLHLGCGFDRKPGSPHPSRQLTVRVPRSYMVRCPCQ
jgi:hypothetical protein